MLAYLKEKLIAWLECMQVVYVVMWVIYLLVSYGY